MNGIKYIAICRNVSKLLLYEDLYYGDHILDTLGSAWFMGRLIHAQFCSIFVHGIDETLRQDIDLYQHLHFHALILDEAQSIKNHTTKTAVAVRTISAKKRFALSGTPIENSLDELWSIFQTILPGLFPGLRQFKNMSSEQVSRIVRPFLLRRVKKDVLKELPDKIETTHLSELTKEQKELYVGYLEQLKLYTRT